MLYESISANNASLVLEHCYTSLIQFEKTCETVYNSKLRLTVGGIALASRPGRSLSERMPGQVPMYNLSN